MRLCLSIPIYFFPNFYWDNRSFECSNNKHLGGRIHADRVRRQPGVPALDGHETASADRPLQAQPPARTQGRRGRSR